MLVRDLLGTERHHLDDLLAVAQLEEVDQGLAGAVAAAHRQLEHALAEHAAGVGEHQHGRVGAGFEHLGDEVGLVASATTLDALAAAALHPVLLRRQALDVAVARQHHDHRLVRDQIDRIDLLGALDDLGAARARRARRAGAGALALGVAVLVADLDQLVADDLHEQGVVGEDGFEPGDLRGQLAVLALDLLALESGQPLQAHVEDRAGLPFAEVVWPAARGLDLGLGPAAAAQERGEAVERLGHERVLGGVGIGRAADDRDDAIDRVDRDAEALDDLAALHRLAQLEARATGHDLAAVIDERHQRVAQRQQLRAAVDDGDHVDAEGGL